MANMYDLIPVIQCSGPDIHLIVSDRERLANLLDGSNTAALDRFLSQIKTLTQAVKDVNVLAALRLGAWMITNLDLDEANVHPHDVDLIINALGGSSIPGALEEVAYIWTKAERS